MALTLIFTLTAAGRAALVNAANDGTMARTIVSVGVTANAIVSGNALTGEIKRIATFAGDIVADDTLHVTVRDDTLDAYSVRGFGLYLDNGVLLGSYGQLAPIITKTPESMLLLSVDAKVLDASVDISTLLFGDTNFIYPPATAERKGVVELATAAEVTTGTDTERAVTPAGLKVELDKKVPTARTITAGAGLTGGGALSANLTFALGASGVGAGAYGGAAQALQLSVDMYGRVTGISAVAATPAWGSITGKPSINTGIGLTGGGDLSATRTLALADTAVVPGSYGTTSKIPRLTVDQQGRITTISEQAVTAGIPVYATGTALPVANIGPIWHDDYQSIMVWRVFNANGANYSGYASVDIGLLRPDTQPTARTAWVKTGVSGLPTSMALYHWAKHYGLLQASGAWTQGTLFYKDVGDGTFGTPDVRGEHPRFWDDSRGADSGRAFGTWQQDAIRNITGSFHAVRTSWHQDGAFYDTGGRLNGSDSGGSATPIVGFSAANVVPTAAENRARNTAFAGVIHI